MNILVINAGSSSLKFQLFDGRGDRAAIKGHYLDIGGTPANPKGIRIISVGDSESSSPFRVESHKSAILDLFELLKKHGLFQKKSDIAAIGHRIVHGGERYHAATPVTKEVLDYLADISPLAPLHNPVGLSCIDAMKECMPGISQYAVFDTAFHRTIPEVVYLYGLPVELYRKYGIRKYGFHGINHNYVSHRSSEILGKDMEGLKIVTCHLGNGQSLCAVKNGKSYDTSMGFTPLEGLPMGTRSGSFDPEIVLFLLKQGFSPDAIHAMVNRQSGLIGLSGIDSHYKTIEEKAREGNADAKRASDILINRIICLIGAYAAEMNGVDAIAFSGGIGEKSAYLRKAVLTQFGYLGLQLDEAANERNAELISVPRSAVRALVIPANEELQIAREVAEALKERVNA